MTNATIAMSFALLIIWMQRHGRWSTFWQAIQGNYELIGSRTSA